MSLSIEWVGTDGSVWDLNAGPVRLQTAGIKGFGMPDFEDQAKVTALRDGQRFTGWRVPPREVWLPLKFKDAGERDVEGIQREWWASLRIGQVGTLRVTDESGSTRSLGLRFKDDGGLPYRLDPYLLSDAFGITFVADDPWWLGQTIEHSYSPNPTVTQSFFGNGAGGTPFYLTNANGTDLTTLDNPGDVPAWIEWDLTDVTTFRLGVDGHYTGGTIVVGVGSHLIIETDPLRQLALLDGVKVTRLLSEVDWAPIGVGEDLPVSIEVSGSGVVVARLTPKYQRAF